MSGLETLSPDQRAVLRLILAQGRGYDDLAATLKLAPAAVRERAHAAAAALAEPADVDPATRERVVDYLLGQQDDGERLVTFAELGDAPAAVRWAQALRTQLAGLAREELPEVPAASANGSAAHTAAAQPPAPAAAAVPAPAPTATVAAPPPPPQPPPGDGPAGPSGPRPSRLGGALLIAGAVALAIVLAIVLIGGGGGGSGKGATASTPTTAAGTQTSTTQARQPSARLIGQAVLRASAAGGSALGAALVEQTSDGRRAIAVEVTRLAPNGAQDVYALWLQGTAGSSFLGFVPRRVGTEGAFTVTSGIASGLDLRRYANVLVTREGTTTSSQPTTPGPTIAGGPLRLTTAG